MSHQGDNVTIDIVCSDSTVNTDDCAWVTYPQKCTHVREGVWSNIHRGQHLLTRRIDMKSSTNFPRVHHVLVSVWSWKEAWKLQHRSDWNFYMGAFQCSWMTVNDAGWAAGRNDMGVTETTWHHTGRFLCHHWLLLLIWQWYSPNELILDDREQSQLLQNHLGGEMSFKAGLDRQQNTLVNHKSTPIKLWTKSLVMTAVGWPAHLPLSFTTQASRPWDLNTSPHQKGDIRLWRSSSLGHLGLKPHSNEDHCTNG